MADKSKIEWTEATWNPVLGCDKISPGCKNCYAIRTAWRLQHNPNPKVAKAFEGLTVLQGGQPNWTGGINFVEERLFEPIRWREPRRIFVNSQSDLFHEGVSDEQRDQIFAVMALCPSHTFQMLTKRADRQRNYFDDLNATLERIAQAMPPIMRQFGRTRASVPAWPWPNLWFGVSCENQKAADERIPLLLQTPAAVRWVSAEPLLGPINLAQCAPYVLDGDESNPGVINAFAAECYHPLTVKNAPAVEGSPAGVNWVVVGGESGPKARPMHPEWALSLRDQCKAAGVPFFFKQWGEWLPMLGQREGIPVRGEKHVFPDGEVMGLAGKKAAGRLLDGKEHSEYPKRETERSE